MVNELDRVYTGVILPYTDKVNPSKYAVHIPELHNSGTGSMTSQYTWASNEYSNNMQKIKKTDGQYKEFGSYFPLESELGVLVKFHNADKSRSAYIIGVIPEHKDSPKNANRDSYYLLAGTKGGSKIYIDDDKDRIHLSQNGGKTDLMMDQYGITMQTSNTETDTNIVTSKLELSENGFNVRFGENQMVFNETGFAITYGENRTFFKMTKKGIEICAEDFLNVSAFGPCSLYGETMNVQGEGALNLRGTNTKLTGLQKLAMNSNIIHLEGVMDTHIKAGMNLTLDSKLFLNSQCIISDQQVLGMSNFFSPMDNKVTSLAVESSSFKAEAIPTIASDGMNLKGMGIATSTAGSVSSATTATMLGLKATMMATTTIFNLDNIGTAIASAVMTDNTIADSAEPSNSISDNLFGSLPANDDGTNYITKLNDTDKKLRKLRGIKVEPNSILKNYN